MFIPCVYHCNSRGRFLLLFRICEHERHKWLIFELISGPFEGGTPDATFSFNDDDFLKVALGKMNPQIAFMRFFFSFSNAFMRFWDCSLPLSYINFESSLFMLMHLFGILFFDECRGKVKIKGSLSAAQKFTPDIFPKLPVSKLWTCFQPPYCQGELWTWRISCIYCFFFHNSQLH